jgi:hypothetical protein
MHSESWEVAVQQLGLQGVTRGYKDGLQPESLADGNMCSN